MFVLYCVFFFNEQPTTGTYQYYHTLARHDALPICPAVRRGAGRARRLRRCALAALPRRVGVPPQLAGQRAVAGRDRARGAGELPVVRAVAALRGAAARGTRWPEIGRASCRERVCPYVYISVVAVTLKKKTTKSK